MLHPYLQFRMEITAFKAWHFKLEKLNNSNIKADQYLREMTTQSYWNEFYKESVRIPAATVKEKIIFLHALGCSHSVIRNALKVSPNTIVDTLKNPPNTRHIQQNDFIDALIPEWNKFKALIPKEIFIKYI